MIYINLAPRCQVDTLPVIGPWFGNTRRSKLPANLLQTLLHHKPLSFPPAPAPAVERKALPLEWLLDDRKSATLENRVLARLVQAEAHEANPHFKDDYRQTFIALSLALRGEAIPLVQASYRMYGLHPDKVWPAILSRRGALLGRDLAAKSASGKDVARPGAELCPLAGGEAFGLLLASPPAKFPKPSPVSPERKVA